MFERINAVFSEVRCSKFFRQFLRSKLDQSREQKSAQESGEGGSEIQMNLPVRYLPLQISDAFLCEPVFLQTAVGLAGNGHFDCLVAQKNADDLVQLA